MSCKLIDNIPVRTTLLIDGYLVHHKSSYKKQNETTYEHTYICYQPNCHCRLVVSGTSYSYNCEHNHSINLESLNAPSPIENSEVEAMVDIEMRRNTRGLQKIINGILAQIREKYTNSLDRPVLSNKAVEHYYLLRQNELSARLRDGIVDRDFYMINNSHFIIAQQVYPSKCLSFSSQSMIDFSKSCNDILIDGTFRECPKHYYQLLIILGFMESKNLYVPLNFTLLAGKTQIDYEMGLTNWKIGTRFVHKNQKYITDFEWALKNAVSSVMTTDTQSHQGCIFHFNQILNRKKDELLALLNPKEVDLLELNKTIYVIKCFPFIEIEEVETAAKHIFDNARGVISIRFIRYFRKVYVFSNKIEFWNILHKNNAHWCTNCAIERFNRTLHEKFSSTPSLDSFITAIMEIERYYVNLALQENTNDEPTLHRPSQRNHPTSENMKWLMKDLEEIWDNMKEGENKLFFSSRPIQPISIAPIPILIEDNFNFDTSINIINQCDDDLIYENMNDDDWFV